MNSAVLLYTMRCNIACAHCSVDSHPRRSEKMGLERALDLVRGLSCLPELEFIDITGGEPMLYRRDICVLAREASRYGKKVRIVSNGFWAKTEECATEVLHEMREAEVSSIGLSIDEWHLPFLPSQRVHHYLAACRLVGYIPLLSCVVRVRSATCSDLGIPGAVQDVLNLYDIPHNNCVDLYDWAERRKQYAGDELKQFDHMFSQQFILINWQPLTSEGRARQMKQESIPFLGTAEEPCDMAGRMPTVDEEGRLFPCCSPWISRKGHAVGQISGGATAAAAVQRLKTEPLIEAIHRFGPKRLIDAARKRGEKFPDHHSGICNQCGMLMDRFSLAEMRELGKEVLEQARRADYMHVLGICEKASN